jgi:hypothetical protein
VGTFRLLLAVIVMLGHLAFYPQPLPYFMPGPIAVEAKGGAQNAGGVCDGGPSPTSKESRSGSGLC